MSLATLGRVSVPALPELVDGLAARTGSWVLVERFGSVVCHGVGDVPCPGPLAEALLSKTTAPLRRSVVWARSSRFVRGRLEGVELVAADLGAGATAWLIGGQRGDLSEVMALLTAALDDTDTPVQDHVVEELLHPRGPVRRGQAPAALLLLLRADVPVRALARAAVAAVGGTAARVHTEDDTVVVALPVGTDAQTVVKQVRATCPTAVGGLSRVATDASDWVTAGRLATGSLLAAQALGTSLGDPTDPVIAAELVVQEAQTAAGDLVRMLTDTPLQRLQAHDHRASGELVASVTAWCRAGFDVPAAAAALHVHGNTLRYRLKRAGEVSGLDLTRPRQLLALQLLLAV
jgi:hypothetical protein